MKRDLATNYDGLLVDIAAAIEDARRSAVRSLNRFMTATYWLIGLRIVEHEQGGALRAAYGGKVLRRLASDLSQRFGRGFSERNLEQMRAFYLGWPIPSFPQTPSAKSESTSAEVVHSRFPLPWSHYTRLLSVRNLAARAFYESEALRGGWTIRQLDRQIQSQFYERIALSRDKTNVLGKGAGSAAEDGTTPDDEIKNPYLLEFLGLRDEYSETEIEAALIEKLQTFLLELGGDFTFVGRQYRLRVGDEWYRVDLVFFHRRLRCLIVIDLKLGKLTHADAGQMHLYLNYARAHWMLPGENPPVGLILCAEKDHAIAKYALDGLPNKVLAAEYRTTLPEEGALAQEIERTRRQLDAQRRRQSTSSQVRSLRRTTSSAKPSREHRRNRQR